MNQTYVQVAPDSTGKKVQTYENSIGGQTVEAQAIVQVNSSGVENPACTLTATTISSNTTIAAGAFYVDLLFSSDFSGTLLGAAIVGSAVSAYSFPPIPNSTYPAIAITVSAGSVIVIKAT